VHELKLDGYRAQASFHAGRPTVYSRRGNDLTARFGAIGAALQHLPANGFIIDGEVIVPDHEGRPNFGWLLGESCRRANRSTAQMAALGSPTSPRRAAAATCCRKRRRAVELCRMRAQIVAAIARRSTRGDSARIAAAAAVRRQPVRVGAELRPRTHHALDHHGRDAREHRLGHRG
jgi:hypothetical protein